MIQIMVMADMCDMSHFCSPSLRCRRYSQSTMKLNRISTKEDSVCSKKTQSEMLSFIMASTFSK